MSKRLLLIMNPGSRQGRGRRLWHLWQRSLQDRGVDFETVITGHRGHAAEIACSSRDFDTVVAVGGDGTINEVLDGVVKSGRDDLEMGVLYSGTSPDFCRFHGIPVVPESAVEALCSGTVNKVDVVSVKYRGDDDSSIQSHFGCSSNIGLGASVARISNRIRRFTGDRAGTFFAVLYALATTGPADLGMELDGEEISLSRVTNLTVLKNPNIASGLRLNTGLTPDDGKMAVFAVHGRSRLGALSVLPGLYSGEALKRPDVFVQSCSAIEIKCSRRREVEFDGDPQGFLPARMSILPRRLNLVGGIT